MYASKACRKRAERARSADKAVTHPLDEARGQQEEGKTSSEWALIAREHVMRTLLATGYFTADDLGPLGIPEHYRKSVHGLVTAYFRGKQPYMEEAGRRKSERPERKGAKNTIFRISAKGRRELPELLKDLVGVEVGSTTGHVPSVSSRGASLHPGEKPTTVDQDVPSSTEGSRRTLLCAEVDKDETRAGVGRNPNGSDPGSDSSDGQQVLELPGLSERPLNPLSSAEAA